MTIGRTPTGAIKTKSDGALRAVNCACCGGPQEFQPCRDCAIFLGNFTFSLTGDQVEITEEFQYPPIICPSDNCNLVPFPNIPPRICSDSWDAFGPGAAGTNLYGISLQRGSTNFQLSGCSWQLILGVAGTFEFIFEGSPDICGVGGSDEVNITSLNPVGSYEFTISAQCVPPFMGPPTDFNFTVTVS
jgi:hypothetical protein